VWIAHYFLLKGVRIHCIIAKPIISLRGAEQVRVSLVCWTAAEAFLTPGRMNLFPQKGLEAVRIRAEAGFSKPGSGHQSPVFKAKIA